MSEWLTTLQPIHLWIKVGLAVLAGVLVGWWFSVGDDQP